MLEKVVSLIKDSCISFPRLLFNNYIKLNLNDRELIILIYLINDTDSTYNPSRISTELSIPVKEILSVISKLAEKGFVQVEVKKLIKELKNILYLIIFITN